jgi:hypothetical protein
MRRIGQMAASLLVGSSIVVVVNLIVVVVVVVVVVYSGPSALWPSTSYYNSICGSPRGVGTYSRQCVLESCCCNLYVAGSDCICD